MRRCCLVNKEFFISKIPPIRIFAVPSHLLKHITTTTTTPHDCLWHKILFNFPKPPPDFPSQFCLPGRQVKNDLGRG